MRDLEQNKVTLVRRDTLEKIPVDIENVSQEIEKLLQQIQQDMYDRALKRRDSMIYEATDYETFKKETKEKNGFYKINWCGETACEDKIKEDTGLKSRCLIEGEKITGPCLVCGKMRNIDSMSENNIKCHKHFFSIYFHDRYYHISLD